LVLGIKRVAVIIKRKENYGFLSTFLISYLSVGAILGQKGDSITNVYVTQGP
jgi:hypothetical protein